MRVVSVVTDLFFVARIAAVAKAVGVDVTSMAPQGALEKCIASPPDLLIIDLHGPGDPLELARALKARDASRAVQIVGFYSHVEGEQRKAALEAGVDHVMPRSAFSVKLPALLTGGASADRPS